MGNSIKKKPFLQNEQCYLDSPRIVTVLSAGTQDKQGEAGSLAPLGLLSLEDISLPLLLPP